MRIIIVLFALVCCTSSILSWLDGLRSINGWIPFIGLDPLFGEILEGASEYGVDIPTSERGEDFLILMRMISSGYKYAILCTIAAIISYAVYLKGVFEKNQTILWGSFTVICIIIVFNCRFAVAGFIHLVNFATSGIFNPYTGDMSNSVLLPFFTWVAVAVVAYGFFKQSFVMKHYISYCLEKEKHSQNTPQTSQSKPTMAKPFETPQEPIIEVEDISHHDKDVNNNVECDENNSLSAQNTIQTITPNENAKSDPLVTTSSANLLNKNNIIIGLVVVVIGLLVFIAMQTNGGNATKSKPDYIEPIPEIDYGTDANTPSTPINSNDDSGYNSSDYNSNNSESYDSNNSYDNPPVEESESYDYSEFEIY